MTHERLVADDRKARAADLDTVAVDDDSLTALTQVLARPGPGRLIYADKA